MRLRQSQSGKEIEGRGEQNYAPQGPRKGASKIDSQLQGKKDDGPLPYFEDAGEIGMRQTILDKFGAAGSLLAAASCPACFPLLGVVGSAVGLGVLKPFEGIAFYVFQALVLLALIGNLSAYFNHRKIFPLLIGVGSPLLIFFSLYGVYRQWVLYTGLFGMLAAAIINFMMIKRCQKPVKEPSSP